MTTWISIEKSLKSLIFKEIILGTEITNNLRDSNQNNLGWT